MSRRKKADPRELLESVTDLIRNDIEMIENKFVGIELDPDASDKLVKYSNALLKIVQDSDNQEDSMKRKLASLSTEELAIMAEELTNKAKGQ